MIYVLSPPCILPFATFVAKLGLCGDGFTEERGCGFDARAPVSQMIMSRP